MGWRSRLALLIGGWLLACTTQAQTPTWTQAASIWSAPTPSDCVATTMTTDENGNVFVTGVFTSPITFGSITLVTAGSQDMFLAKYVPATNTWAWAVRGGGLGADFSYGVAVSGSSIYLTGTLENNTANSKNCTFSGAAGSTGTATQLGASSGVASNDLVLAKYIDNGTSATFGWSQVAGGTGYDSGCGVAVSGNNIYLSGSLTNTASNANGVVFGGSGTIAGTWPQYGTSSTSDQNDILLAKYIDHGTSAGVVWTQVAGGKGDDASSCLVVSGSSLYLLGTLENNSTNANGVVFGGAGTTAGTRPQYGATPTNSADIVLAKYTDTGSTAAVAWTQVAGGTGADDGYSLAVSGTSVYITGQLFNNLANTTAVVFGGTGPTPGTVPQVGASTSSSSDLLLAKYTDNGTSATFGWSQVAGGTGYDSGYGLAVSGNTIYLSGEYTNSLANANAVLLGGSGTTPGTVPLPGISAATSADILVAKYVDNGASAGLAWTQTAGGARIDYSQDLALVGSHLYVLGLVRPAATFGSLTISPWGGATVNYLATLDLATPLATPLASASSSPRLYPNPASGPATLTGATAHTPVLILDALGRRVATATADASGTAPLPAGLAPGLYLVRAGAGTVRWVVE